MSAVALPAVTDRADELFGHPKGLYVCFFTEMWERFSFYGMKALLLLYLVKHHAFAEADGYVVVGAYGGMVYAVPLLGGPLADRYLGMRKAVVLGGILLCLGHLGMAYEGHQAELVNGVAHRDTFAMGVFYLSLSLIISGVGFLKPNISTIVGKLYPDNDPRVDSGFTIFYAGINVGALFSSLICGYLGEVWGWGWGFGAAGVGMVAGLGMFVTGQKYLQGHAEPRDPERLRRRVFGPLTLEWFIYLCAILGVPVIWLLMYDSGALLNGMINTLIRIGLGRTLQLENPVLVLQLSLAFAWLGWLLYYIFAKCNKVQREQMATVLFFILTALLFFSLYEQTYGSWLLFTEHMLTKDFFPSLVITQGKPWPWCIVALVLAPPAMGVALRLENRRHAALLMGAVGLLGFLLFMRDSIVLPQTAESLEYLASWVLIVFTPLFGWLWPALERRGFNPSKPVKTAIGLAFTGLSFLVLSFANATVSDGHLASVWWLLGAYVVLEIGELCLSPIGLAAVTQLSVPSVIGVMMGAYWLATSLSEWAAARMSSFAALDITEGAQIDLADAKLKYGALFHTMLLVGLIAALVTLALSPLIKKWMHGVK